jgi:hypothetical protein
MARAVEDEPTTMNRTARLLLALLTALVATTAVACDEESASPNPVPIPSVPTPAPVLGADPEVIAACQAGCDAKAGAVRCSADAQLAGQVAACKAFCPEEIQNVARACDEIAIAAYQCLEVAGWSCFGGASPRLADDECDAEIAEYRRCIVDGE